MILLCGLGQVGYRVATLLVRLGERVVVVTEGGREDFIRELEARGVTIHRGDARDDGLLLRAGLRDCKAVIAATNHDLVNIEIALDVRRLHPAARLVVRMFDQVLARQLEDALGIDRALAMSRLSAPAFALAGTGATVRGSFTHGERRWVVRAAPGAAPSLEPWPIPTRRRPGRAQAWLGALREAWSRASGPMRGAALVIVVLALVSIVVFQQGLGLTPVAATYFVITTLTTTGYGDITPKDAGPALQLYACLLMLLGSAAVAVLYSFLTEFIVGTRFDQALGRQRVTADAHVVLVGLGSVGLRVVEALGELGHPTVVIDEDPDTPMRALLGADVAFVHGDGRDAATLERAGVRNATAVIAVTDDDAVNLSVALAARRLNPEAREVVRLFDAGFAAKVAGTLPIDASLSASREAAPAFVAAALEPDALYAWMEENRFVVIAPPASPGGPFTVRERALGAAVGTA